MDVELSRAEHRYTKQAISDRIRHLVKRNKTIRQCKTYKESIESSFHSASDLIIEFKHNNKEIDTLMYLLKRLKR